MAKYRNHICLISHQNTPELLGGLMPGPEKPKMHAIVTPEMKEEADRFRKTCLSLGLECELYELPRVAEIERVLDEIWLKGEAETWATNITGGTKIMAIAAYGWAIRNKLPAFYVDTAERRILFNEGEGWKETPLPKLVEYETLMNLHGYAINEKSEASIDRESRIAIDSLLARVASNPDPFHIINRAAFMASEDPFLTVSCFIDSEFKKLLGALKNANKLDFTDRYIRFNSRDALSWCQGLWLEEYVASVLDKLKKGGLINSWTSNVKIDKAGYNELDAVFTANNRLHVIECKTSKMKNKGEASILYKADSIRGRLAGIFTQSLICSVDELSPASDARAKEMNIRVLSGANLKNLRKFIINWIGKNERN